MTKKTFEVYHTDAVLRRHRLLVHQKGDGLKAKFRYVDVETHRPASEKRILAFEKEAYEE